MYDRNEIKEIIDGIMFLKKYTLFDNHGYDEKAKVIEELKSDLYNAFGIDEWYKMTVLNIWKIVFKQINQTFHYRKRLCAACFFGIITYRRMENAHDTTENRYGLRLRRY